MKFFLKNRLVPMTIMFLIIICIPSILYAQDPGGGADVPVDGGLSVLIAAGVGYGLKKYKDQKNKV